MVTAVRRMKLLKIDAALARPHGECIHLEIFRDRGCTVLVGSHKFPVDVVDTVVMTKDLMAAVYTQLRLRDDQPVKINFHGPLVDPSFRKVYIESPVRDPKMVALASQSFDRDITPLPRSTGRGAIMPAKKARIA